MAVVKHDTFMLKDALSLWRETAKQNPTLKQDLYPQNGL